MRMRNMMCMLLVAVGLLAGATQVRAQSETEALLERALAGAHRSESNRLRDKGKFFMAHYAIENLKLAGWQRDARAKHESDYARRPELYRKPMFMSLGPPEFVAIAPAGSADLVLTFRNVHNWSLQKTDDVVFKAFFDALKPSGVLGVVEHRAHPGTSFEQQVKTGYMT